MQFRKLLSTDAEERAVSPVIGVILMVAITVILAAVIASFVLGLGQNQEVQPTADFNFDYDSNDQTLTIRHASGDNVPASAIEITGSDGDGNTIDESWPDAQASASVDGQSAVSSGDAITLGGSGTFSSYTVTDQFSVQVVWQGDGSSAELASESGPDA